MTFASATQVNAIVPYEIVGQTRSDVVVEYQSTKSTATAVTIATAAPGVFTFNSTGTGQAVAANQDYTFNGTASKAAAGSTVVVYFTGGGVLTPPGSTGSVTGAVFKYLSQSIAVTVGGKPATVRFAGAAPSLVDGVNQLNITLATDTPSGTQPIVITVGANASASTATLEVK